MLSASALFSVALGLSDALEEMQLHLCNHVFRRNAARHQPLCSDALVSSKVYFCALRGLSAHGDGLP